MHEPFARRVDASVVLRGQQRRLQLAGGILSAMFAYRRQISPQLAALILCWLVALSASEHCNISIAKLERDQRLRQCTEEACEALVGGTCPGLAAWQSNFYGSFRLWVVTRPLLKHP